MTTALELRLMAILLGEGARIDATSRWLLGVTALLLPILVLLPASTDRVRLFVVLLASLVAGVLQLYCAIRCGFDRAVMEALAARVEHQRDDAATVADALDQALHSLGLQAPHRSGRGWPARWRGMRRWLQAQGGCLLLQLGLMVGAVLVSVR